MNNGKTRGLHIFDLDDAYTDYKRLGFWLNRASYNDTLMSNLLRREVMILIGKERTLRHVWIWTDVGTNLHSF